MSEIRIVDTTIRDGNACIWGEKMNTAMMAQIAPAMNRAGFHAIDATAVSHFEYAVRYLRENPWERMRLLSGIIRAPLSMMMLGTSLNLFRYVMGPVMGTWMERLKANGVTRVQVMEPSNNMLDMAETVRYAKAAGVRVALALVYTRSEVHTDEYFTQRMADAVSLRPDVVYLKDPGGLLTPERTRTIFPAIMSRLDGTALEFHSHCTTALAPLCYLEALRLGVETFHTASAPLANGPSQPSTERFLKNARHLGHASAVDGEALEEIARHFEHVARLEGLPTGQALEYDEDQFVYQIPGGVISNLKRQLAQLGLEHRLEEILEETIRVRAELGYPIMVTPFSQFVVAQATVNVIQGERYKTISDEIIRFALGRFGRQVRPVDPLLLERVHGLSRTKDFLDWDPPSTSIEDLRAQLGAHLDDDDLLLLALVSESDFEAMRATGPLRTEYSSAGRSLPGFIREMARQKPATSISIRKDNFSLTLRAAGRDPATAPREEGAP